MAKSLKIKTDSDDLESVALSKIARKVNANSKKQIVTLLIIDEFGKFLEYAVNNNPDKEVYFIQLLAEFFNDSSKLALSISSLHQNFASYGGSLTAEQFKEWEKVKGRLKEIAFNEPIDQLLFFATQRNNFSDLKLEGRYSELFDLIKSHNVSDKKGSIDLELAENLLPIDYISAEIMAKALQRYGQNERSLFSFLDVDESYSFKRFYNENNHFSDLKSVYSLEYVFDYIFEHYFFVISSHANSDLTLWNSIREALDQVDTRLEQEFIRDGRKIIKAIGLLNIFTHAGSNLNREFLEKYALLALNIESPSGVIDELISHKIISYKAYKHRFVFVSWTDLNIDFELQKASSQVNQVSNVAQRIEDLNEFPPILEKAQYFKTGTPRLIEYKFTSSPLLEIPKESDAIINYIFSEDRVKIQDINEPIIYAVFTNTDRLKALFFEIDKAQLVIQQNLNDIAAVKELEERIFMHRQEIKTVLFDEIYDSSAVKWYDLGIRQKIQKRLDFNKLLSTVLWRNYRETPVLKNELINKSKLSTPISLARKKLITHLLDNSDQKDLGFEEDKFPPEKTIYLSLIKSIGFHHYESEMRSYILGKPDFRKKSASSYQVLWETSMNFLKDSKKGKKNIEDLFKILEERPLKLKKGFIEFWIPLFLIIKRDDYALFNETGYIPNLDLQVFDVLYKSPKKFWIKAFDVTGVKLEVFNRYKSILKQKQTALFSEKEFINTIKPFILFVRSLPDYTLNTQNLSQESLDLRDAIRSAKDPEKAFFEDFPKALNYSEALYTEDEKALEGFVKKLNDSIRLLRDAYDELLNRFEVCILKLLNLPSDTDYNEYKDVLTDRFESIDSSLLNSKLRNIHRKFVDPITERKLFLEGLTFAILGKSMQKIRDDEVNALFKGLESNYKHLLKLVDIHALQSTRNNDEVYSINILDKTGQESKHQIMIPLDKLKDIEVVVEKVDNTINGIDKDLKKAVLM